jgi:16S rRNA (adenine1518-N6/adenine1519-N6)-dimethyltransferase
LVTLLRCGYDARVAESTALPSPPTCRELQALLRSAGLRPNRRLGQHFLIDGNLMRKLVEAAEMTCRDFVLEVGAGTGGLTRLLAARAGRILAVEIDPRLAAIAKQQIGQDSAVDLLVTDVLERKSRLAEPVRERLSAASSTDRRLLLVANLPYQIASPLLVDLLLDVPAVSRLCFTVQLEVGDRLAAKVGTKQYGQLSVLVQATCTLRRIARVPASAFWPRPKVDSVMMRLDTHGRVDRRGLWRTVRMGFAHRRKMLKTNLAEQVAADQLARLCDELGLDPRSRPEALIVSHWVALADWLARHRVLAAPATGLPSSIDA